MQSGFNIIQTIHILGEMEKEMESLKQLISIEQKIQKIKEKKKQVKSISMASKSTDSLSSSRNGSSNGKRTRSYSRDLDDDDETDMISTTTTITNKKSAATKSATNGSNSTNAITSHHARVTRSHQQQQQQNSDPSSIVMDENTILCITEDTFPYQSRYSTLCPSSITPTFQNSSSSSSSSLLTNGTNGAHHDKNGGGSTSLVENHVENHVDGSSSGNGSNNNCSNDHNGKDLQNSYSCALSMSDQEYYAKMLALNDVTNAEYYLELVALLQMQQQQQQQQQTQQQGKEISSSSSSSLPIPNNVFPAFFTDMLPRVTSVRMEMNQWDNDLIRLQFKNKFSTRQFTLKPYLSYDMCMQLTQNMSNIELNERLRGLGFRNGQLMHYPFSLEEQLIIKDFLARRRRVDASLVDRLPMRNLISVQLYLDDMLRRRSQYEHVIEYHDPSSSSSSRSSLSSSFDAEGDRDVVNNDGDGGSSGRCASPATYWSQDNIQCRNAFSTGVRSASYNASGHLVALASQQQQQQQLPQQQHGSKDSSLVLLCEPKHRGASCRKVSIQEPVQTMAHSCHGRFVILGCNETIKVMSPMDTSECLTIKNNAGINSIAPHPYYERIFATASKDRKIVIWDIESGKRRATIPTFLNLSSPLATEYSHVTFGQNQSSNWLFGLTDATSPLSPSSSSLLSPFMTSGGDGGGRLTIFDLRALNYGSDTCRNPVSVLPFQACGKISFFQVSEYGTVLATCTDTDLNLFDLRLRRASQPITDLSTKPCLTTLNNNNISSCSFSDNDRYLCVSMRNSSHFVYDLRKSKRPVHQFEQQENSMLTSQRYSAWGHPDASTLLAATFHNTVAVWDVSRATKDAQLAKFDTASPVNAVHFSPDCRTLACATESSLLLLSSK